MNDNIWGFGSLGKAGFYHLKMALGLCLVGSDKICMTVWSLYLWHAGLRDAATFSFFSSFVHGKSFISYGD